MVQSIQTSCFNRYALGAARLIVLGCDKSVNLDKEKIDTIMVKLCLTKRLKRLFMRTTLMDLLCYQKIWKDKEKI